MRAGRTTRLRPHRGDAGFTLIELLVVIVVLGVLSAVTVFAVRGTGDKGKSSAIAIDDRTIRTAEEAYCAKNGRYGSGDDLVTGGFLSDEPEYHEVAAQQTGFGPCNGWAYSSLATAAAGVQPRTWSAAPTNYPREEAFDVVRLPNGKAVVFGRAPSVNASQIVTDVWDPSTGEWAASDPMPAPPSFNMRWNLAPVLTNNCGTNCGKVLIELQGPMTWWLFDPTAPLGSQWENITPNDNMGNTVIQTVTELRDNPTTAVSECGAHCGDFLLVGGTNGGVAPVDLYDPNGGPQGVFVPVVNSDPTVGLAHMATLLPDGRVFLIGRCNNVVAECGGSFFPIARFFDPLSMTFSVGPQPTTAVRDDRSGIPSVPPPVMANGDLLVGGPTAANGTPTTREVYRPQNGQQGSWVGVVPSCGPSSSFCHILGALPDGRVLAYSGSSSERCCFPAATVPGQSFVLDRDPATGSYAWIPAGDFAAGSAGDAVLMDPRTGPCGQHCNKMLMVGNPKNGGEYHAALFTP